MSGLSREARALLDSGRRNLAPSSQDRERVRRSLMMKAAAAGAAVGATAVAGTAKAGASSLVASLFAPAVKVAAGVVLFGAVASGGYFLAHHERRPAQGLGASTSGSPMVAESAVLPAAQNPESAKEDLNTYSTAPSSASSASGLNSPLQSASAAASSGPDLSSEVARLREAQRAMRDGRPSKAIEALGTDSGEHSLALEEEREAMKIFALCRMGKADEAREAIARFASRWPQSLYGARVKTACESPPAQN